VWYYQVRASSTTFKNVIQTGMLTTHFEVFVCRSGRLYISRNRDRTENGFVLFSELNNAAEN